MPYVELPGVNLFYQDTAGTGVPVVLLHAASGTSDSWVHQVPAFTDAGYRCISYDRRCWGRSRPAPTGEQPGYSSVDLLGLADHLGLDRFHLVAVAAGAVVGLDFSLLHPQRVRSLVVADSGARVQEPDYQEVQRRLRPPEIDELPIHLRELGASYRGTNAEGTRRWREIEQASLQDGIHGTAQPLHQPMSYARLETLRVPVLLIGGEADLLSPPALMRMMADHIPGGQFLSVPEAGHAAFWEQPEVWNRLVLDFIKDK
ncbi:MAG: alpha/beta fold hydrolase [Dehalococcoidia bacterium]